MIVEIKDLLTRFSHILLSEEVKKETLRGIISEIIGIQINSSDIKLKNGTIYLNIKPIYKNEILLKKDEILFKLNESFGKKFPKDIR